MRTNSKNAHKKLWMETGKMRTNSKNAHKKLWMETGKMRINSKNINIKHKLRWKHINRINSSMRIEKSRDLRKETEIDLTSSGLILFTASRSCYGHSEKPEESLSSKYFCIIVLHDCVLKQPHPAPNAVTAFIVLRLLALRRK